MARTKTVYEPDEQENRSTMLYGRKNFYTELASGRFSAHPDADLYPMLEGAEREEIASTILDGFVAPIYIDRYGRVVDGRNRISILLESYRVIYPMPVTEFEGSFICVEDPEDPANNLMIPVDLRHCAQNEASDLILKLNEHRRHLTPEQKAAIRVLRDGAERAAERKPGRPKNGEAENLPETGKVSEPVANMMAKEEGVPRKAMQDAMALVNHPEELEAVAKGEKSLVEARMEKAPPKKRRTKAEIEADKEAELDDRIAREVKPGQKMARPLDMDVPAIPERKTEADTPPPEPKKDALVELRAAFMALPLNERIPGMQELFRRLDTKSKVAFASFALEETEEKKEQD